MGADGAPQGLINEGGARQTIAVFAPDSIIGSLLEKGLILLVASAVF